MRQFLVWRKGDNTVRAILKDSNVNAAVGIAKQIGASDRYFVSELGDKIARAFDICLDEEELRVEYIPYFRSADVLKLREDMQLGLDSCKKVLEICHGDMEDAKMYITEMRGLA